MLQVFLFLKFSELYKYTHYIVEISAQCEFELCELKAIIYTIHVRFLFGWFLFPFLKTL